MRYEDVHWGDAPDRDTEMVYLAGCRVRPIGEVLAVSYVTSKDGKPGIWRHEFEPHEGHYPRLMREDPNGGEELPAPAKEPLIAIGVCIDFELVDGRRVFASQCWLATDPNGECVRLASPYELPFGLEAHGHFVTAHGIEE